MPYDLDQHLALKKHKKAIQAGEDSKKLSSFFQPTTSKISFTISLAEATLSFHTVNRSSALDQPTVQTAYSKPFFKIQTLLKVLHLDIRN